MLRITLAALAISVTPVQAQDKGGEKATMGQLLSRSAVIEWVFSNCDNDGLDAGYLMAAQAVLAGSPQALSSTARTFAKEGAEENYTSRAEACSDMRRAVPDSSAPPRN